eukprot:gene28106-33938_t
MQDRMDENDNTLSPAKRNYAPHSYSSSKVITFDIGVVIALPEELNLFLHYIQEAEGICNNKPDPICFWSDDLAFWRFELHTGDSIIQVVAYLVGEMGAEYTGVATNILIEKWKIPFIVNIGVTGSFDPDLKVGSILIPTQITHYTSNWKVKDSDDSKPTEFLLGTRAFATNSLVLSQFGNYLMTSNYAKWKAYCKQGVEIPPVELLPSGKPNHNIGYPSAHLGHHASGNMVVDSEHYKKLLKATDRKLMACDMEAAGFAIAEQFLRAPIRMSSQFVALRCISDMAADKVKAESGSHVIKVPVPGGGMKEIESREFAMRNVTIFFMFLVKDCVIKHRPRRSWII